MKQNKKTILKIYSFKKGYSLIDKLSLNDDIDDFFINAY
jgi:hypothetical protein